LNRNDKNGPKLPDRQDISNRKFPSSSGIFDSNSNFPGSANRGKNEIPASGGINPCFNGGTFVRIIVSVLGLTLLFYKTKKI